MANKIYVVRELGCFWIISKSTFYRYKKNYPFADIDVFANSYVITL